MKRLVVATRNKGKIKEITALLSGLVESLSSAAELVGFPETVEDGNTFEENALKKAREACLFSGVPALADDSGLVVEALGGGRVSIRPATPVPTVMTPPITPICWQHAGIYRNSPDRQLLSVCWLLLPPREMNSFLPAE